MRLLQSGFTSFATDTYRDIKTLGKSTMAGCPKNKVPMDTGQTDRVEELKQTGGRGLLLARRKAYVFYSDAARFGHQW